MTFVDLLEFRVFRTHNMSWLWAWVEILLQVYRGIVTAMSVDLRLEWINQPSVYRATSLWLCCLSVSVSVSTCVCVPASNHFTELILCVSTCCAVVLAVVVQSVFMYTALFTSTYSFYFLLPHHKK